MQAISPKRPEIACVGAVPIAVTDCLNFFPEKPGCRAAMTEAIYSLAEACRALDVPIVSGNVSLYNETAGRAIPPTPTVGMVGLLDDVASPSRPAFLLIHRHPARRSTKQLPSEYMPGRGPFPRFELGAERHLGNLRAALTGRAWCARLRTSPTEWPGQRPGRMVLIGALGRHTYSLVSQHPRALEAMQYVQIRPRSSNSPTTTRRPRLAAVT